MLSWIARLLLTSTAVTPVLLVYAWVAYQDDMDCLAGLLAALCVVLILLCLLLLRCARKKLERTTFKVVTVEAADRESIAFLLLYLLPLFTEDMASFNWQMWIPALLIFGIVVATGYTYHFNPLLRLIGWHFYKVNTKQGVAYVLITKKHLRNTKESIIVGQLTEYVVIDLEENQ